MIQTDKNEHSTRIISADKGECGPSCGCGTSSGAETADGPIPAYVEGVVFSKAGVIPQVSTELSFKDKTKTWQVRWGWGRMKYAVRPGLYAVGNPTPESHLFVSANYKLSFDALRSSLKGRDGWILVLDTRGVNVWCAAGKGTFGTEELINRINAVRLPEVISHKKLILPQLGAPGVRSHEVRERTGFRIIFGPVRAEDLPEFLDSRLKATPEMRRVRFEFRDRLTLIPVEITSSLKWTLVAFILFFVLSGLGQGFYSFERMVTVGFESIVLLSGAWLAGTVITPALLPWLPGRAFSTKGGFAGLAIVMIVSGFYWANPAHFTGWLDVSAWTMMILAVSSFLAMNFTGASTFTSLSGVVREMKMAVPVQILGAAAGFGLWITARFV